MRRPGAEVAAAKSGRKEPPTFGDSQPILPAPQLEHDQGEETLAVRAATVLALEQARDRLSVEQPVGAIQHLAEKLPPRPGLQPRRQGNRETLLAIAIELCGKQAGGEPLEQDFALRRGGF